MLLQNNSVTIRVLKIPTNKENIFNIAMKEKIEIDELRKLIFYPCVQETLLFAYLDDCCCLSCSLVLYNAHHALSGENIKNSVRFPLFQPLHILVC